MIMSLVLTLAALSLAVTTFAVGHARGRLVGQRAVRELTTMPECAHVFGKWVPQQRHTATEYPSYSSDRIEKHVPVLRRTCELCQWQEDRKVPLT